MRPLIVPVKQPNHYRQKSSTLMRINWLKNIHIHLELIHSSQEIQTKALLYNGSNESNKYNKYRRLKISLKE